MKSIKLTVEHKTKLLEMCKILFPEYNDWKYGSMKIAADDELWCRDKKNNHFEIHWFEFCSMYLAEKILDNSSGDNETSDLGMFTCCFHGDHPVDYLYEEFKKLKL